MRVTKWLFWGYIPGIYIPGIYMPRYAHHIVAFCIQLVVVPEVLWTPRAGIGQGDPFAPALFVLLAWVLILVLHTVHPQLHMRMYADGLVIYIGRSPNDAKFLLQEIVHALNTFVFNTGIRMIISKSKVLLKGLNLQQFVESSGLKLADNIRYLGVMIGQVTKHLFFGIFKVIF